MIVTLPTRQSVYHEMVPIVGCLRSADNGGEDCPVVILSKTVLGVISTGAIIPGRYFFPSLFFTMPVIASRAASRQ